MTPEERQRKIVRFLRQHSSTTNSQIARTLGTHRETVRRDLNSLEQNRIVIRSNHRFRLNEGPTARAALLELGVLSREERFDEISRLVQDKQQIRVSSLSKRLHVTAATIRSDLAELSRRGILEHRHGIATAVKTSNVAANSGIDENYTTHEPLIRHATQHIESGDTIFLDDTAFARHIAFSLDHAEDITIITNSLTVANSLKQRHYPCEVLSLASRVSHGETLVERHVLLPVLEEHAIRKAFFGVRPSPVNNQDPIAAANHEQLMEAISTVSERVFVAVEKTEVRQGSEAVIQRFCELVKSSAVELMLEDSEKHRAFRQELRRVLPGSIDIAVCGMNYIYHIRKEAKQKVGFTFHPGSTDFRQKVSEGIDAACARTGTITLYTRHNRGDYETIVDGVKHLVDEGVDLLIDYSNNYDVAVLVSQIASERRIPLILVDSPVQEAVYFGANNIAAGRIAGDAAADEVQRRWNSKLDRIVILEKSVAGPPCRQRVLGSLHAVRERIKISTKHTQSIDCSKGFESYARRLEKSLSNLESHNTCLVISFGEDTTVESHDLIAQYARNTSIIMVGQNYSHHVHSIMRHPASPLIGCVSYAQELYGERIIDIAKQLLNGKDVAATNYTTHAWVSNPYLAINCS